MDSICKIIVFLVGNVFVVFVLLQVVVILVLFVFYENFCYVLVINILFFLKLMVVIGVMVLGVGILMVVGEFDLFVGLVMIFVVIVMVIFVQDGWNVWFVMVLGLVMGGVIGFVNGYIFLIFFIFFFIMMLGGFLFFRGVVLIYYGLIQLCFELMFLFKVVFFGDFMLFGVKVLMLFLWFIFLVIVFGFLLYRYWIGNYIYVVGGGESVVYVIGVNVFCIKMIVFVICGMCVVFVGVFSIIWVFSVQFGQGVGMEFQVIVVCVIGGFVFKGGCGVMFGVVFGVVFIYILLDIFILLCLFGYYFDMVIGIFLVVVVIVNQKFDWSF